MSSKSKHNHHNSSAQPAQAQGEKAQSGNSPQPASGEKSSLESKSSSESPAQNSKQADAQGKQGDVHADKQSAQTAKSVAQNEKTGEKKEAAPGHVEHNDTARDTVFRFEAPSAHKVLLAGEFSQWDKSPIEMIKGGGGWWHTKVPLPPGRHFYRILVDGVWQNDPASHERVANSFGTFDDVLEIS